MTNLLGMDLFHPISMTSITTIQHENFQRWYNPWRIHGAGILMLTKMGYIDGIHGTPYISSTMDPMGKWILGKCSFRADFTIASWGLFGPPPKNNPIVLPCFTHENMPFNRRVFTGEILRIFPMLDRLLQGFPWTYPNHFPTFFNGIIIYKSPCLSHQNHRTPYLAYHYYPKDPSKIHYPMLIPHPSPIKNNTTSAAETPPWLDTTHRASLSQEPYT